jgi:hypothetical protein
MRKTAMSLGGTIFMVQADDVLIIGRELTNATHRLGLAYN